MNLAEYTIKLLSRYKLLEVSKIENPRFNVLDIWKHGDTIYAIVDNIEPLKEVTEPNEYGDYEFMGVTYTEFKRYESEEDL